MSDNKNSFAYYLAMQLKSIFEAYPKLLNEKILTIAPVKYTVADICITIEEKSYENLEVIPSVIMRLISIGIDDIQTIAKMTALTPNYIKDIFKQLEMDRQIYIENGKTKLTDTAIESIEQKQYITQGVHNKQIYSIDALTGKLLNLEEKISTIRMNDKVDTASVPIDSPKYIEYETIVRQFIDNPDDFLKKNKSDLNVNVNRIADNGIEFIKMNYVRAMLIEYKDETLIFAERKPEKLSDNKSYYAPFFVMNEESIEKFDLPENTIVYSQDYSFIGNLLEEIGKMTKTETKDDDDKKERIEKSRNDNTIDDIRKEINTLYDFIDYDITKNNSCYEVLVDCNSFGELDNHLMFIVEEIGKHSQLISSTRYMMGDYFKITSKDEKLIKACKDYVEVLEKTNKRSALMEMIRSNYKDDVNVIDAIIMTIDNLKKGGYLDE